MPAENPTDSFFESVSPPATTTPALQALWWAARGRWKQAHTLVQDEAGNDAAWVHAHLHRIEGDLANAKYWYRKAGRQPSQHPLEIERAVIAVELLKAAG